MLLCHEKAIPLWQLKVTGYCSRTYTRYSFHLKQPRLDVYFFQPNIEFSSYVYEVVYCPKCYNNSVVCGTLNRKQTVSQKKTKKQEILPKETPSCTQELSICIAIPPSWTFAEAEFGGKLVSFDHACMTAPLRLLIASCRASLCCASQLILHGLLL